MFLSDECQMEVRPFPLSMFLECTKFVVLSVSTLIKMICMKIWTKSLLKNAKSPLPVDVRRSKCLFCKFPSNWLC